MTKTRKAYLSSVLVLILCVGMLIGTTFAWFTDQAMSGGNIIKAGKLDVEMYWTDNLESGEWYNVEDPEHNTIFGDEKWEPGYTEVRYIKLVNKGNLALNYNLTLTPQNGVGKLAEVINVYFAEDEVEVKQREDLQKLSAIGLLSNVLNGGATANGTLLAEGQSSPLHKSKEVIMTLAASMITTAGNEYQGEETGEFTITALATQAPFESDSFGSNYDSNAELPTILVGGNVSALVTPVNGKVPTGGVTLAGEGLRAYVPEGVALKDGTGKLTLSVKPLENTTSNITVVNNEVLIPVDVHIDGVAEDNTVPIIIDLGAVLPKYLNMGNYHLFHVEEQGVAMMTLVHDRADLTTHNAFTYDPLTGEVSVAMKSFSEVALVADTAAGWEGGVDYSWYKGRSADYTIANADQLAAFGNIVGGMDGKTRDSFAGKTVKLLSDINLGDAENTSKNGSQNNVAKTFHPIGYSLDNGDSTVKSFEGTFDGNGHTISSFYQNTWEIKGDYDGTYYKDAMGLFGYVVNGTIKNLTVDNFSSDGEFTPTGVVAAYAVNSEFENIAITNCNPRVYNTGNGGIIGIAGRENATVEAITLTNITVDDTNKISALWGSWDVACGGLVGMYRGNVDSNGIATGDTISFKNCHVASQIDVYNDVCANYQYYAYRYSGMIIGSIRHNVVQDGYTYPNMEGISAKGCTVHFDTWNDYFYCELVANSQASYTHDYQFSRLKEVKAVKGNEITYLDGKIETVPNGRYNYCVVDGEFATDNALCYHFVDGEIWNHKDAGTEEIDGKEINVENHEHIYLPFTQLFTGYGWGVTSRGLSDFEGVETIDITYRDDAELIDKFEKNEALSDKYIYRVGNGNAFPIGMLFQEVKNGIVVDSGVHVSVTSLTEGVNFVGTFNRISDKDWTQNTLHITGGTGLAKLSIRDYNNCKTFELIVEVVDAINVTEYKELKNENSVLLTDITMSGNSAYYLENATLYGNGFKFDCRNAVIAGSGSVSENYIIGLMNANLDNVQIVGAVYSQYGPMASSDYNRALVVSKGTNTITNCYLSNTASPIRLVEGNLEVKGTTVKGGNFANIDVRNGHLVVEDVTTINQALGNDKANDGSTIIGLGIVVYYENVDASLTSVTIKGTLNQYNHISKNDTFSHEYATKLVEEMMKDKNSQYQYKADGVTWVNPGYVAMTKVEPNDNQTNRTGYVKGEVSFMNYTGYAYAACPNATSIKKTPSDYSTIGQGPIAPEYSFDYTNENYVKKTEGSNDYCYYDNGKVLISMDQDDTFSWNPYILSVTKEGQILDYTVTMEGKTYQSGEKIQFNKSGEYTVVYNYTDDKNYTFDDEGNIKKIGFTYEKTVKISVAVVKPAAKNATFTFGSSNTETEKVTVNNKTYVSAKGVSATDKQWGYITVNGTKVFYPITEAQFKKSISSEYTVYYYVFNGTVTIIDYKEGGTGSEVKYDASTTTKPDTLEVVNGMEAKYTNISSACVDVSKLTKDGSSGEVWDFSASTTVSGTTKYNGYLAYQSPSGLSIKSGTRDYDAITVAQFSYKDAAGATYYYFVGYYMPNQYKESSGSGNCVTPDTLVTLANGSQVRVDSLTGTEQLLVWNMETGSLDSAPIMFVDSEAESAYEVIKLYFSDGTEVKVISEHGFWDYNLNKYVYLDRDAADYIGHTFAKQDGDKLEKVTLVDVVLEEQVTSAWSPVTVGHLCYFVNGMLSMPGGVGGLFNIFDVDAETMTYDYEAIARDIETYGLLTYEELSQYADLSREMFEAAGGQYLKISIGKGNMTMDELIAMIERYSKFI